MGTLINKKKYYGFIQYPFTQSLSNFTFTSLFFFQQIKEKDQKN